jgi:hypothetical protein
MARWLTWIASDQAHGWGCSECEWLFPVPELLNDPEAKRAYDRLASHNFQQHNCTAFPQRAKSYNGPNLTERARKLVMRGFKPKDAVDVTLQEIELEFRSDAKMIELAKREAEDFLRRVKEGLI